MILYILLSILILLFIINIIYINRVNKKQESYLSIKNRKINNALTQAREEGEREISKIRSEISSLSEQLSTKQELTSSLLQQLDKEAESRKELLNSNFSHYYENKKRDYENDLKFMLEQILSSANEELFNALNINQENLNRANEELQELSAQIEDYKRNRDVINEEISRQREIDEQVDFYRVCLSEEAKEDISLLSSIMSKLSKKEAFNKLLYDTYVSKPVQEMIKRVLKGRAPSGIYKITRLKTKEVYIGRSSDIKTRWQQHCKSAFNVGTIAHSQLHTTMERDGIENFTFELLEECPKENLNERETYWIKFFGAKEFGLNEKL